MEAKTKQLIMMYYEIRRLRNVEHFSIQRIADHLSIDFRTVKRYLEMREEEFEAYSNTKGRKSQLLDPYREFIVQYLKKYEDAPYSVVHDRLKEHYACFPTVDPKTVYNYVMHLRNELNLPRISSSQRQYSPVPDVQPGDQAQVDFGEKKLRKSTGEWITTYFFVMLLCFSRYKFLFFRERPFDAQSAVEAHEKAFEFFGGIPRQILYDQDAVFLRKENKGDYLMTEIFDRYQAARPFQAVFCRAADPESKGKVENTVKYVKQNFLFQRTYINIELLNEQAILWLNRTGNAILHNTTRKVPAEQWAQEQHFLQPWTPVFNVTKTTSYKVLKNNVVKYRGNSYSLPFGTYHNEESKVYLTESEGKLVIRDDKDAVIATHLIPAGAGHNVINSNHRRDTSVKLDELRNKAREFFSHSSDIETFLENIDRLYPRYVRDQLTTLLSCAEKSGRDPSEKALAFCVENHLFSANDFTSMVERKITERKRRRESIPEIKPLGDAKTQLMVNLEPEKSDIGKYEFLFNDLC